jgi:Na+-driven multidrug efflux pump
MMDWWFNIFGPFSWLFMILGMGIYIGASILIAFYVHKDAVRRGIVNSEIWLIIALIFNIFGLLIYLIVRGNYMKNPVSTDNKPTNINK